MKPLSLFVLTLTLFSCSTQTNRLSEKKQTLQLHYTMWACACANWATLADINKYQATGLLDDHCVFVEPAYKNLILPDTIGYSGDIVEYTGQFYVDEGFPKDFIQNEEPVDKAKVFRYSNYKIIKSNYRNFINVKDK